MLVEKYGGQQNIRVFNMDEIIKEALEYITPKKVDETAQVDKKAKKGKVEEVVNVDVFEGKHPSDYKKIANEMKTKFFSDFEGDNLPQQGDLPNLVFDDQMMVNLFVERLKLEYEGQDLAVSQADLEAGILREKELVDQLAEMEENTAAAEPAKKGGKPAAKGGKTSDLDTLKEELDSICSIAPKGWILVDFPRNLTQMKLLETCLSGYESKADLPKDEAQARFEAWAKVATPSCLIEESATGGFNAIKSGIDGVIILETPDVECTRRSQNRKIDPQTQTVYHMETDAPEDAKVLDRL